MTTSTPPAGPGRTTTSAAEALRDLYAQEWAWRTGELGPLTMTQPTEVVGFLPQVDEASQERRRQRWEQTLVALERIPRSELTETERLDYDVYAQQLQTLVASQRFRLWERPVNADSAFWRNLTFGAMRQVLMTDDDARSYLGRLAQIPRYFAQQTENMRAGLARGFGPPRITLTGREEPVRAVAQAADVTELALFAPLRTLPEAIDAAVREELQQEAAALLREVVVPAYAELLEFLVTEYLPNLPESIAAHDQPEGEAFYAAQLREFTTTDLSPQQIFDIGMEHVRAIRAEMEQVAAEVGFTGDVAGMLAFMRADAQFYASTPRQLIAEAAYTCKAFDGVIHRYFGRLPDQRFAIVQTPPDIAPFDTFGRGAPDAYILNTYNLPARPLYSLPALTLHESAPGHSFQLSLARELDLPDFRRQYISAFGEGWGLYCERLGVEMGMYTTPFETMGMLSFQMWRAVRLVVDPGMHALGWSREQAQDFLRENTAIAEHEIVTEIDRYIAWPGQAAAYYLGQLSIQKMRARAEAELGAHFDIRDFHDTVLGLGSVPLAVFEEHMERFIDQRRAAHA
ncbi:DUF885 domain-containing protein [Pseudactinotalea sp. Z1739]|uniref:DUF885 domain-containing protein n=1 Tax=Pseudactinotalea sp. Z1739 TaxID=3413028 RepID=UPI003C7EA972